MRFSKAVVKYRIPILILTVFLMIPAVIGIANTRINYDMLNYLPEDMDTIIGQNELMEDFGKGAFSFIIVEDMPNKDVAALKARSGCVCGHHNINVTVAAYGVLNGQNYNIFPLVHSLHSFIEWLYETIICSIAYYI